MVAELQTDSAVLSTEASSFMSISQELTGVMHHVEQVGGALAGSWEGMAAGAAQQALVRFHEAAAAQTRVLDDIADNIHSGGVKYDDADHSGASTLATAIPDIGL